MYILQYTICVNIYLRFSAYAILCSTLVNEHVIACSATQCVQYISAYQKPYFSAAIFCLIHNVLWRVKRALKMEECTPMCTYVVVCEYTNKNIQPKKQKKYQYYL